MKDKWLGSTIYQIYPRSYQDSDGDGIGDLRGIINRLDHVEELGAEMIWLCPVYTSPNHDNGYDISDYYSIQPEFGDMETMRLLIKEAHRRGIGIMMDIVANHTSDEHYWFESSRNRDVFYGDFYIWRDQPNDTTSFFGGPAWTFDERRKQYYFHSFSKHQPDLNWENPYVREEMANVLKFWTGEGVAGFRFDVIDLIAKDVDRKIWLQFELFEERLRALLHEGIGEQHIVTVGEAGGLDLEQVKRVTGDGMLSMVFNFETCAIDEVAGKTKWHLAPFRPTELKRIIRKWQEGLEDEGWNSLFWNNHDQPRALSRWLDSVYLYEGATMLAMLQFGLKGTTYVYQGEEFGMTNGTFEDRSHLRDIESLRFLDAASEMGFSEEEAWKAIQSKGRDNARIPMRWQAGEYAGFSDTEPWIPMSGQVPYLELDQEQERSVFRFYQNLIALRKSEAVFRRGDFTLFDTEERICAYERTSGNETMTVICNLSNDTIPFSFEWETIWVTNYARPSHGKMDKLAPYEALICYNSGRRK